MTVEPEETADPDRVLVFAHLGDLHLTDARQRNYADFLAIVAQIEIETVAALDFVVLPGDNADNGKASQYRLAATALKMLSVPVHVIPGDHDMEQGSLEAFHAMLCLDRLPKALTVRGTRCLFLDMSGPGSGRSDFCLGQDQMAWVERELADAADRDETTVVFMHSYPADLRGAGEAEALTALFARHDVALVDIGHTHYNELANDGRTIFAATRSTGQIEEGPVGYSIATLDGGVVGWRFRALDEAFPFVQITAPADHRLMRGADQAITGRCAVRAIVFGATPPGHVACRVEGGPWTAMAPVLGQRTWSAAIDVPDATTIGIEVRATDASGRPASHGIRAAGRSFVAPSRTADGSDADAIGAWPENGIFGTQLGPNRNGGASS